VASRRTILRFPLGEDGGGNAFSAPVREGTAERVPGGALALTTGSQSVFNRRRLGLERTPILVKPYAQVSNHLVFVNSRLGQHYYGSEDRRRIALYQLEGDPLYPGRSIAAVGRHLLFRVVNPGASVRLALDVSASFKGDGASRLPPAAVLGTTRVPLPLVGAGSARVFSPVVVPREIDGHPYVALDMGVEGAMIPVPRTGLMNLYGRNVPIDSRRIVVFARDVSLVPEEEYAALQPPARLSRFPADLANPGLEYSGLYEDGWISEAAYVVLTRPAVAAALIIRGSRPIGPDGLEPPELSVRLDGREAARPAVIGPEFTLRVDVPPGPGRLRVDLRLSSLVLLARPDNRRIGFLLRSIGFEP